MSGTPTEGSARQLEGTAATGGTALVPGVVLGSGRYRLLAQYGRDQRCNAQLWRARDGQLKRDVALTVLMGDPADPHAAARITRTLERAMHAARFTHPGIARVLDVLSPGNGIKPSESILGMVVAEWTQGTDMVDLVNGRVLPPATACRLIEALAAAVEGAHHAGLVLGADHPQRIRVTPNGHLRLAFPGPCAEATARDDVKGLGALLYLLLTGRWALPGGPEGIPTAPVGPGGAMVSPGTLQPGIPHALSSVAVRSLEDTSVGGIRTSAAILQVLAQVADAEAQTTVLQPVSDKPEDRVVWTTRKPVRDAAQQRKLAWAMTALAVATLLVLAWLGVSVVNFFTDSPASSPLVVGQTSAQSAAPPHTSAAPPPPPSPTPAGPIQPSAVAVYDVGNNPDSPNKANLTIDGNPGTSWRTDTYYQNFPRLKPGIGLMLTFPNAVKLAQVIVTSPSSGVTVEIRTAPSATPDLDQTAVIGTGTLTSGDTPIPVQMTAPSQYVLVWITSLAGSNRSYQAVIADLKFQQAA